MHSVEECLVMLAVHRARSPILLYEVVHVDRQKIFEIVAWIHSQKPLDALRHEAGSGEQHKGQRHLGYDQRLARPLTPGADGGSFSAFLQGCAQAISDRPP